MGRLGTIGRRCHRPLEEVACTGWPFEPTGSSGGGIVVYHILTPPTVVDPACVWMGTKCVANTESLGTFTRQRQQAE